MQILRSADYHRMPWRNGGGETREVAVSPLGATLDALDWRISIATVASDGPFSVFSGVVRTLCVIRGAGIRLGVGNATTTLVESSDPYTFDGEAPTSATLIDGPIVDLNVMSRRGRYRHSVDRRVVSGSLELKSKASSLVIFSRSGSVQCLAGAASGTLKAEDCAVVDDLAEPVRLIANQRAELLVIELYRESTSKP